MVRIESLRSGYSAKNIREILTTSPRLHLVMDVKFSLIASSSAEPWVVSSGRGRNARLVALLSALSISSFLDDKLELLKVQPYSYERPLREHCFSLLMSRKARGFANRNAGPGRTPVLSLGQHPQGGIHTCDISNRIFPIDSVDPVLESYRTDKRWR